MFSSAKCVHLLYFYKVYVVEECWERGTSVQFDPQRLTDEQKEHRCATCADYIQNSQNSPYVPNFIFAENKSWGFQYDFEVRCQSIEWR
jgi:hypothetical protein